MNSHLLYTAPNRENTASWKMYYHAHFSEGEYLQVTHRLHLEPNY